MKKLISILLLLAATTLLCRAQSVTKTMNSIVTTTPTTALTSASSATTSNSIVQVDYFDGLGRPVQTVQVNGSSAGADLATKQVYDKYGQVIENWLPVPASSNNGAYVSSFNSKSKSAYSNDSYAYIKTEYEPSPLARLVAVYSPGAEMKSHPATIKYTTNYNMNVKKYAMSSKNEIVDKGTYANGSLFVKIEADQDGCTTQTFTDKLGNVILERRVNGSENYDTYYVYSNYDTYDSRYHHSKLCAVMPPGCNVSNYAEAAYIYRYDERHRCVYKKIPGADPVTYVYDNADRLTYSQDGEQRKRGVYTYYSYDSFNRVFSQGECSNTQGSNKTTLVTNYYDNYNFMAYPKFSGMSGGSANTAKGLKTGAIISVLGSPSGVQCEVYSYDYRGRLEKTMVKDVYGMVTTYTTTYNFCNQVTEQKEEYKAQGITKTTTNTYDLQGRLTKEYTTVTVSNTTKATAQVEFTYNQVGRLSSKKIGTTSISYLYNTQGQLLSATSTPFTEKLYYNNHSDSRAKKYFNGNISAIYWKHSGQSANTTIFDYDKLNRLVNNTMLSGATYTETGFSYNDRGGITDFTRMNNGQPTKYTLTYSADNHLTIAQTDKGLFRSFSYDANGNQTSAPNGLTITYNSINQPQQVKSGSTVKHKFAYLADGRKLHSISDPANDGGLAYIGSSVFKIYRGKYDGFESTSFSAGRIVRSGSGYTVQYHITDHLGSVRAVLNQSMTVLEQNDYYPFGLRRSISSSTTNRYHYNGKEEIAADATSDYGARQYSAEFCQWLQVDPLAEKYYSWSPYNFCVGNPLRFVDPDGCEFTENAWVWVKKLIEDIDRRQEKNDTKIAKLQSRIDAGGSERKINRLNNKIDKLNTNTVELEVARSEIGALAVSDQLYDVQIGIPKIFRKDNVELNGAIYCNSGIVTAGINADINKNSSLFLGTLAHELKHAYQFEMGKISFNSKGVAGIAYDYTDEIEAHTRGGLFGAGKTPNYEMYKWLPINSKKVTNENFHKYILKSNYFRLNGVTYKP